MSDRSNAYRRRVAEASREVRHLANGKLLAAARLRAERLACRVESCRVDFTSDFITRSPKLTHALDSTYAVLCVEWRGEWTCS